MTPKDKAHALWINYRAALSFPGAPLGDLKDEAAKQCALVAVDELIEESEGMMVGYRYDYWVLVRKELENL